MALILVTGGAGFIGSHLVDALVQRGHRVRILDSLEPQVHGVQPPSYLNTEAELITGDLRNPEIVREALEGADVLFHQAAVVGVGQSMYEIQRYVAANTLGAATLLDVLVNQRDRFKIRKMIVASSMSIYGEGAYRCEQCGVFSPILRSEEQLARRQWEIQCPNGHGNAVPVPTGEDKPLYPTSIYAITKRDHEELFLCAGRAYGIPTVALRYFNAYGTRQALSNPYTGVAAIFSGQLLNGQQPMVFEDGEQLRDFVHVDDIVQANLLAMERPEADYGTFNIGAGEAITIRRVAEMLIERLHPGMSPHFVGRSRAGDIRHCYADITRAVRCLGYAPAISLRDGLADLVSWVCQQRQDEENARRTKKVHQELEQHGLTR